MDIIENLLCSYHALSRPRLDFLRSASCITQPGLIEGQSSLSWKTVYASSEDPGDLSLSLMTYFEDMGKMRNWIASSIYSVPVPY